MLTILTLFTTLTLLARGALAQTPAVPAAPVASGADSSSSGAQGVDCSTGEGVSKYISCQKSKFSTTQLVIGGIGVVLALFLIGFGIVWFLNRKKKQNVEDGGEAGKRAAPRKQAEKENYSDDSEEEVDDRRRKTPGNRKESSDEDSDEESEVEKPRPPPTRQPQVPSRQQQQQSRTRQESQTRLQPRSSPATTRAAPKEVSPVQTRKPSATPPATQKSRAAKVETESEDEDDSSEEETDTDDDSEEDERPEVTPAPKPEIKKPQAVVQRIPRTESPEIHTDEGSPVDRRSSRQLYASNPSPNPRHLQRVSSDLGTSTPIAIPQSSRSRQGDTPSASPSQWAPPGSRESTMPLNIKKASASTAPPNARKGSATTVRQPAERQQSFYEPSSRPPVKSSLPRTAIDSGAEKASGKSGATRRPSEGQGGERRPSEAGGKGGSRKGSSSSRKADRI